MTTIYLTRPFQTQFKISTNDERLITLLSFQYGGYISNTTCGEHAEIIAMKNNTGFTVMCGEIILNTELPLLEIHNVIRDNTVYDDSVLALHGAAVEWNGRAYLFLAPTTSGKTTLASYLSSNGFGYITDDCILIDRRTHMVYPYPCPIHLRDGGLEVLEKAGHKPKNLDCIDDPYFKRYAYLPDNIINDSLPVGQIFFSSFSSRENKLDEIPAAEQVMQLLKSPIINYPLSSDYIKLLISIAKDKCCEIKYKDMDYVADIIKSHAALPVENKKDLGTEILKHRKESKNAFELTVTGDSMHPFIYEGDTVTVQSQENYSTGDILVYKYKNEGTLVHRLIEKQDDKFYCKGDNSYRMEEVTADDIYGKVIEINHKDSIAIPSDASEKHLILSKAVNAEALKRRFDIEQVKQTDIYNLYKKIILKQADTDVYIRNASMDYIDISDTETVIFDPESGNAHFLSNLSGKSIVEILEEPCDMELLLDRLCQIFEAGPDDIRDDVVEFIDEYIDNGVILKL